MPDTPTLLDLVATTAPTLLDFPVPGSASAGSQGIGQTMGPMLASDGGMPGMMADMGIALGQDMGQTLGGAGGMKALMKSMGT